MTKDKIVLGRTTQSIDGLPHAVGSLTQGSLDGYAGNNNQRAQNDPQTGEVVGIDSVTGDSLVRQPGGQVVRVQAGQTTVGNTVSIKKDARDSAVQRVRSEGTKVSSKITAATGWQRIEGEPDNSTRRVSSTTVVRSVDDFALLSDPCVPPDVKISIVTRAAEQGLFIGERDGKVAITSTGGTGVESLQGFDAFTRYLDSLYKADKSSGQTMQTLTTQVSLDSLGGTATPPVAFVAGQTLLWKCEDGRCVQALDGVYSSREDCEMVCGAKSFSCINGRCVEVAGVTGSFQTLNDCLNSTCGSRFTCIGGECVPAKDGEFETLEQCQNNGCYWGYTCNNGECVPAIGGLYRSLQCCQDNCVERTAFAYMYYQGFRDPDNTEIAPFIQIDNSTVVQQPGEGAADDRALAPPVGNTVELKVGFGPSLVDIPGGRNVASPEVPGMWAHFFRPGRVRHSYQVRNLAARFIVAEEPQDRGEVNALIGKMRYTEGALRIHTNRGRMGPVNMFEWYDNTQNQAWENAVRSHISPLWFDTLREHLVQVYGVGSDRPEQGTGNSFVNSAPNGGFGVTEGILSDTALSLFPLSAYGTEYLDFSWEAGVLTLTYPDLLHSEREPEDTQQFTAVPRILETIWEKGVFANNSAFVGHFKDVWNLLSKLGECYPQEFYRHYKDEIWRMDKFPGLDWNSSAVLAGPVAMEDYDFPGLEEPEDYRQEISITLVDVSASLEFIAGPALPRDPWEFTPGVSGVPSFPDNKTAAIALLNDPSFTNLRPCGTEATGINGPGNFTEFCNNCQRS